MNEYVGKHFGVLIAYVLPGFVTLWGLRPISLTINSWLSPIPTLPAGIESVVFVGLASITAGMTVSAIRWAIVDTFHHCTGTRRPTWDDSNLNTKLGAFDLIVEAHYRHYLFYANTAIAVAIVFGVWLTTSSRSSIYQVTTCVAGFEVLFVATSRDALRKYYARTARLLGLVPRKGRRVAYGKRQQPRQAAQSDEAV